eukprot:s203_g1.t1
MNPSAHEFVPGAASHSRAEGHEDWPAAHGLPSETKAEVDEEAESRLEEESLNSNEASSTFQPVDTCQVKVYSMADPAPISDAEATFELPMSDCESETEGNAELVDLYDRSWSCLEATAARAMAEFGDARLKDLFVMTVFDNMNCLMWPRRRSRGVRRCRFLKSRLQLPESSPSNPRVRQLLWKPLGMCRT